MRRLAAYLALALILTALATWAHFVHFRSGKSAELRDERPTAGPSTSSSHLGQHLAFSDSIAQQRRPDSGTSTQLPPWMPTQARLANIEAGDSATKPRKESDLREQTRAAAERPTADATAVIGRPFPVSTSVMTACRSLGRTCAEELEGLLQQFAQEPRDPAWATDIEAKLRHRVMTVEPGKFLVRSVECRTSLCALEVASIYGRYPRSASDDVLSDGLFHSDSIFGYETDSSAARITITLALFERR